MFRINFFNAAIAFLISVGYVSADGPTAKKYLEDAKKLASEKTSSYWADARKKLDLAELELEGVPADQKKSISDSIEMLRKELDAKVASENADQFKRDLKRILEAAESDAGNLATWPGTMKRFEEFSKKPGVAATLLKDLEDAKVRIETMNKLYVKAKLAETIRVSTSSLDDLEAKWNAGQGDADGRKRVAEDLLRDVERTKKLLAGIPEDHAVRKALNGRLGKIAAELQATISTGAAGETARRLQDSWDLDSRETAGWEKENASITFEQYCKESSATMSAFGAPKTVAVLTASTQWLKNRVGDAAYMQSKDAPEIKAIYDAVSQAQTKSLGRMLKAAETIVSQAEKTPITDQNQNGFQRLIGNVRINLGESPESPKLQDRIQKLLEQKTAATAEGEKGKAEWYAKMTANANLHWPDMKKKLSTATGFDPQNPGGSKGKIYSMMTDNLMGYRFKPGDFQFATTLSGHAIAAKYDGVVAGAIEEVEKKLGRSLGDNDDDGKWEIFYRVEGTKAKLNARKQVEGDVTVEGRKVGTYRGEYSEPTDAAIVTIVAAKCGPLAVSADEGMITESGDKKVVTSKDPNVARSGGSSYGYGIFGSICRLFFGVIAAFLALLFAGFKPLSEIPTPKSIREKYGVVLAGVGGVIILYAVTWLIGSGGRGFFAGVVLMLTGIYIVAISLQEKGIFKRDAVDRIRNYGVILGFACLGMTILTLLIQGHLWVI